jgi:hypothetical protein
MLDFLTILYVFSLSYYPQTQLVLYQTPGFNEGELISTYFDVEFILSDYFFIGGDTEIFFHPDGDTNSFSLNSAYYNFNLGFRFPIHDGTHNT